MYSTGSLLLKDKVQDVQVRQVVQEALARGGGRFGDKGEQSFHQGICDGVLEFRQRILIEGKRVMAILPVIGEVRYGFRLRRMDGSVTGEDNHRFGRLFKRFADRDGDRAVFFCVSQQLQRKTGEDGTVHIKIKGKIRVRGNPDRQGTAGSENLEDFLRQGGLFIQVNPVFFRYPRFFLLFSGGTLFPGRKLPGVQRNAVRLTLVRSQNERNRFLSREG